MDAVRGLLILDADGQRITAKYYHASLSSKEKQVRLRAREPAATSR